jgi:D-alanyl-D-alanine carboxypeptidase
VTLANFMLDLGVPTARYGGGMMKLRDVMRFLGATAAALVLLLLLVARVTGCSPLTAAQAPPGQGTGQTAAGPLAARQSPGAPQRVSTQCRASGWSAAAQTNANSLQTLAWAPFGRAEVGWETYVPLIQHEIRTACPANSEGFAAALAAWQRTNGQSTDGVVSEAVFGAMKGVVQTRRDFVRFTSFGTCPGTPDLVTAAKPSEGFSGKQVWLRPRALDAYRRMVAAARAEAPEIAADPQALTIFSGYRSPAADAARCQTEGNCDGVVRARCSAHRTGLAADITLGHAPGFTVDSSADPNRLYMSRTAAYRWLVANAGRFGFVNYPFEPWHWEWTGEQP